MSRLAVVALNQHQALGVLAAMERVASSDGAQPLSAAERANLDGAAVHVLGLAAAPDTTATPAAPADLAGLLPRGDQRTFAVELLAVTALVDGDIDAGRLELVAGYADALGVHADFVRDLAHAARGQLQWTVLDMSRRNVQSIAGLDWHGLRLQGDWVDRIMAQFLPYDGNPDPELAARFRALGQLPYQAFGRAFYDHYTLNGYPFPGEQHGLAIEFAVPHDSAHLLSGYSTSTQGEILVSTFTAAMHRKEGMAGHILPVIFSWHLGVQLNPFAGSARGALDPEKFWDAWERGAAAGVDTFDPGWDFWSVIHVPIDELRRRYAIPPLDAAHVPVGEPLTVRPWIS